MTGYAQFCPVAKAAEVLDQRWTLLVIRELVAGSARFNDLHRGVPRMSRTLLSQRLSQLQSTGIVTRKSGPDGPAYELTAAGCELSPVIQALGEWGVRWMSALQPDDLDPVFLLWDMHRSVDHDALPAGRTVLAIAFHDVRPQLRYWWLLLARDDIDICDHNPGFETDVSIDTSISSFIEIWRGDRGWADAIAGGHLTLTGRQEVRRQVPQWFRLSHFASVPRPRQAVQRPI